MELINYRGLNCHLACIINMVAALGLNYRDAFATLWSETDFTEDPQYHICLSKRVTANLETLGVRIEILPCESPKEAEASLNSLSERELFLVGMDTFHIPWSLMYQNFHGPHFYIARKEQADFLFCFDPTYYQKDVTIPFGDISTHAFELSRIRKIADQPLPRIEIRQEALEVLHNHPQMGKRLRMQIQKCKHEKRKNMNALMKEINAMINNRYLFQRYLHQFPFICSQHFFDRDFLLRWEAVKNGLLKASIMKKNESIVNEVCDLFQNLIQEEIHMAEQIVKMEIDLE